jgi:hypothetical protein
MSLGDKHAGDKWAIIKRLSEFSSMTRAQMTKGHCGQEHIWNEFTVTASTLARAKGQGQGKGDRRFAKECSA